MSITGSILFDDKKRFESELSFFFANKKYEIFIYDFPNTIFRTIMHDKIITSREKSVSNFMEKYNFIFIKLYFPFFEFNISWYEINPNPKIVAKFILHF